MAELSSVEKDSLAIILCAAFSKDRDKHFTLPPNHEELEGQLRCDLVLRADDGELLQVEHTRPSGDVLAERIHPAQASTIDHLIQQCLNAHGARGTVITLVWEPPPEKKQDQVWIAEWVCSFILAKLRRKRLTYFSLDVVDDWDGRLRAVVPWLKKLVIAPGSPDGPAGIIGSTGRAGRLVDDAAMLKEALERKASRYGPSAADLILAVDFDLFPLQFMDMPEALEVASITRHHFKEVWAVNNYAGNQNCRRLWPPPAGTPHGLDRT
jgi:hypothetical protein